MASPLVEALSGGPQRRPKGPKCGVWVLLQSLSPEEKEHLIATMRRCHSQEAADFDYTMPWLSKVLTEQGYRGASPVVLRRHMRGECACDESDR